MLQRDIKKAIAGEDFNYYNFDGEKISKPIRVEAVNREDFDLCFNLWEDFHYLKLLPHGGGTLKERRWVVDIIKYFEKAYINSNNFFEAQAIKKANSKNK